MNQNYLKKIFSSESPEFGPGLLIIGAQKAGTTALFEYLSKHPRLKSANTKEINFFSCDKIFSRGKSFYHSHFPGPAGKNTFTFEASPSYLHNANAYERIYSYNPDIKLIAILRNPVDRAYSAWNMYRELYENDRDWFFKQWASYCTGDSDKYFRRKDNCLFDFKEFISEELEESEKKSSKIIEAPVLNHGLYFKQLKPFLSLFKKNQVLTILSRDLREQTQNTLITIENWLGINHHEWLQEDLRPVFEKSYNSEIDEHSKNMLTEFYMQDSKNLAQLIDKKPDWFNL